MDQVVVGALLRGQQVLLCHRSAHRQWFPDAWDFPGGHVEFSEDPREALVRELREELGIEVPVAHLPAQPQGTIVTAHAHLTVWRVDTWQGEPVNAAPEEHDAVQWFDVREAVTLDLAHPESVQLLEELAAL